MPNLLDVLRGSGSKEKPDSIGYGLDRHWPRGKVLSQYEALEVMATIHPELAVPHDIAAMAPTLNTYIARGLITTAADMPGAYMRPEEDLEPIAARQKPDVEQAGFVAFGETKVRILHVQTIEGEVIPIKVPYPVAAFDGPRDKYLEHLAAAIEDSKRNPLPAE